MTTPPQNETTGQQNYIKPTTLVYQACLFLTLMISMNWTGNWFKRSGRCIKKKDLSLMHASKQS